MSVGAGVMVLLGVALAVPPVEVVLQAGEVPAVRVRAAGEPVHLPACRGVTWEGFDIEAGRFVPLPAPSCGAMAPATRIDAAGATFTLDPPPAGGGVVRPLIVVGLGCRDGVAFELAGCREVVEVAGPQASL